jgi:hypothetical protein
MNPAYISALSVLFGSAIGFIGAQYGELFGKGSRQVEAFL